MGIPMSCTHPRRPQITIAMMVRLYGFTKGSIFPTPKNGSPLSLFFSVFLLLIGCLLSAGLNLIDPLVDSSGSLELVMGALFFDAPVIQDYYLVRL